MTAWICGFGVGKNAMNTLKVDRVHSKHNLSD